MVENLDAKFLATKSSEGVPLPWTGPLLSTSKYVSSDRPIYVAKLSLITGCILR